MKTLVVIPARYASTRLPGKPLAKIAGQTLLQRVVAIAQSAAKNDPSMAVLVATDDARIGAHAEALNVPWIMTSERCLTGTDRVKEAAEKSAIKADFILNMQGDAPLTPPDFLTDLVYAYSSSRFLNMPCDVVTPVVQLSWEELDKLRSHKKETPFSGTTAVFNEKTGEAYWFSKNIIPAIRGEEKLRSKTALSTIWRHVGLYGYHREALSDFTLLPETPYEKLEGLEQLRFIENGYKIKCVPVDYAGRANASGVDSPEDIIRIEGLIKKHGELKL